MLLIYPDDRPEAEQLLRLYGFDAVNQDLYELEPIAAKRGHGKHRIMLSELVEKLPQRFRLTIEDYQRANLPAPDEVANAR